MKNHITPAQDKLDHDVHVETHNYHLHDLLMRNHEKIVRMKGFIRLKLANGRLDVDMDKEVKEKDDMRNKVIGIISDPFDATYYISPKHYSVSFVPKQPNTETYEI